MAYIGNNLDSDIQVNKYEYTATAGQTTFACTYDRAVDVYVNGVKLDSSDFTATTGTSIVLASGANVGDIVDINAYFDVTYANIDQMLPAQTGQTGKFLTTDGTNSSWGTVDLTQFAAPVQLKNYTTTERNALTGLESGDTIFNSTTGSIQFYDGANWISTNLVPTVNSVDGDIYADVSSTLTLNLTNATSTVDVKYYEGETLLATDAGVTVTSGSCTSSVPAAVYGQTAGDIISVTIFNVDGTPASNSVNKTVIALPSGGTITSSGSYRYHAFTSSGTFSNTLPSLSVEYIVVAGGAGGGSNKGGGGGAGGAVSGSTTLSIGSNTITVGAGGARASGTTRGNNGSNSSAFSTATIGGGAGGGDVNNLGQTGSSGGSGGGGSRGGGGGSGTSGQGYNGGSSINAAPYPGGGGGGRGGAGANASGSSPGNGGSGTNSWADWLTATGLGVSGYIAGGGGAVGYNLQTGNVGSGGAGGGGTGSYTTPGDAVINTGSGGGASDGDTSGAGGSGIVIIRYQLP